MDYFKITYDIMSDEPMTAGGATYDGFYKKKSIFKKNNNLQ
jgi:hypothetical protein